MIFFLYVNIFILYQCACWGWKVLGFAFWLFVNSLMCACTSFGSGSLLGCGLVHEYASKALIQTQLISAGFSITSHFILLFSRIFAC